MDEAQQNALFSNCAAAVRQLLPALVRLEREAFLLQVAPLVEREWFELLRQKLVPQLGEQAFLVVAVVGGTNIGKSVIFNHLAGLTGQRDQSPRVRYKARDLPCTRRVQRST